MWSCGEQRVRKGGRATERCPRCHCQGHTHAHTNTDTHTNRHTHTQIDTHTHTHAHTHSHIYIFLPPLSNVLNSVLIKIACKWQCHHSLGQAPASWSCSAPADRFF